MNQAIAKLQLERARAEASLAALRPAIAGAEVYLHELQNQRFHWQEFIAAIDEMLADYDAEDVA